jgi:hypothetical protein
MWRFLRSGAARTCAARWCAELRRLNHPGDIHVPSSVPSRARTASGSRSHRSSRSCRRPRRLRNRRLDPVDHDHPVAAPPTGSATPRFILQPTRRRCPVASGDEATLDGRLSPAATSSSSLAGWRMERIDGGAAQRSTPVLVSQRGAAHRRAARQHCRRPTTSSCCSVTIGLGVDLVRRHRGVVRLTARSSTPGLDATRPACPPASPWSPRSRSRRRRTQRVQRCSRAPAPAGGPVPSSPSTATSSGRARSHSLSQAGPRPTRS